MVNEDDALRAVRAAADLGAGMGPLNDELERDWGVRLEVRTGVNTGEVVTGDPGIGDALVLGDAVNVAARLEQVLGGSGGRDHEGDEQRQQDERGEQIPRPRHRRDRRDDRARVEPP